MFATPPPWSVVAQCTQLLDHFAQQVVAPNAFVVEAHFWNVGSMLFFFKPYVLSHNT